MFHSLIIIHLTRYLLLIEYINNVTSQDVVIIEDPNSDVCDTDDNCADGGICLQETQRCNCKKRNRTYPFCTGGRRRSRNCVQKCARNKICRKRDGKYVCVPKVNCSNHCGHGSKCRKKQGKIICTACGSGYQLLLGECRQPTWGEWSPWGICSTTCGTGRQSRTRTCQAISQQLCSGEAKDTRNCFISEECYGTLSEWGGWSICTKTCGGGLQNRYRICLNSNKCNGHLAEQIYCNVNNCPGIWSEWGQWSPCSVTCNNGIRKRSRTCSNNSCSGGSAEDSKSCTEKPCVGVWSDWGSWSACPNCVNIAVTSRSRYCTGGFPCKGITTQSHRCYVCG